MSDKTVFNQKLIWTKTVFNQKLIWTKTFLNAFNFGLNMCSK